MTLCSPSFKNFNKVVPQIIIMVVNVICCVGLARLLSLISSQNLSCSCIAVSIVQECLMKTHDHMHVGVQGLISSLPKKVVDGTLSHFYPVNQSVVLNLAFSNTLRSLLRAIASLVPRLLPLHGGGETPWYTLLAHVQIIPLVK